MATRIITVKYAASLHLYQHQPVLQMEWTRLLNLTNGQMPWRPNHERAELEQRIWELEQELNDLENELFNMGPDSLSPAAQEQVRTLITLHDQWGVAWPTELHNLAKCLPEYQEEDVEEG